MSIQSKFIGIFFKIFPFTELLNDWKTIILLKIMVSRSFLCQNHPERHIYSYGEWRLCLSTKYFLLRYSPFLVWLKFILQVEWNFFFESTIWFESSNRKLSLINFIFRDLFFWNFYLFQNLNSFFLLFSTAGIFSLNFIVSRINPLSFVFHRRFFLKYESFEKLDVIFLQLFFYFITFQCPRNFY